MYSNELGSGVACPSQAPVLPALPEVCDTHVHTHTHSNLLSTPFPKPA